jgi:hypothetical protein
MRKGISTNRFKIFLGLFLLVGIGLVLYLLPMITYKIHEPVKSMCEIAQEEYPGDCVEALIAYIESDHHSYKEKNQAIWTIGVFGDERALPVLEKLYTGEPCPKPCTKTTYICQYELEKAIRFSKSGTLLSPWFRRTVLAKNDN